MVYKCLTFIFLLFSFIFCMNNAGKGSFIIFAENNIQKIALWKY